MSNDHQQASNKTASGPKSKVASEEAESNSITSPGKQLSAAREALGLTQQQVAQRLHLRVSSIKAVEQDALEPGVSVTFNKGYVRLYAKLVHLEVQPILDLYDNLHATESQPAKLQSFSRRVTQEANDYRWNIVTIIVVLLITASVIVWWVQQSDSLEDSQNFVSETFDSLFSEKSSAGDDDQATSENSQEQNSIPETNQNPAENSGDKPDENQGENPDENQGATLPNNNVDNFSESPISEDTVSTIEYIDNGNQNLGGQVAQSLTDSPISAESLINEVDETQNDVLSNPVQNEIPPIKTISSGTATTETLDITVAEQEIDTDQAQNEAIVANEQINKVFVNNGEFIENDDGTVDTVFTFSEDCWVSVKDINGNTVAIGIKDKGRVMEISGLPPLDVIICAPRHVAINFGGKDLDLTVYSPNRSANFTLPLESE